jgi:3-deoxy-D-manno-octulosonic-acid transferase
MFNGIFVRSKDDRKKFLYFLKENIRVCGNLKGFSHTGEIKKVDTKYDIITFGSIHTKELDIIVPAVKRLINEERMIVIAPRHLEKLPLFEKRLKEENIDYSRRTKKKWAKVVLLDTYGELVSFYKNSKAIFIGGSLIPNIGGHNPIEGLLSGRKVIFGPYMDNFKEEVNRITKMKLGFCVHNEKELIKMTEKLLQQGNEGYKEFFNYYKDVLSCYVDCIERVLMSDEKNL